MTETAAPKCVFCERTNQEVPLVTLNYQDQEYYICPEHIPLLIHNPQQTEGCLPGAGKPDPARVLNEYTSAETKRAGTFPGLLSFRFRASL